MNVNKNLMAAVRWAVVAAIIVLLGASVVWTVRSCRGPRSQPRLTKRLHLTITDKADEKTLLQLFTAKNGAMEEIRVIRRMGGEKNQEMAQLNQALQGAFQMDPAKNYRYDASAKTIYELVTKPGVNLATNAALDEESVEKLFDKKLHRQLATEDEVKQFARLAAAKKMTADQIQSFQLSLREKQMELARIEKTLSEKFSMVSDRNYQYDTRTMKLYELIVTPQAGEMAPDADPRDAAVPAAAP